MEKAMEAVKTIEVTHSVRATSINGLKIKKKQPIGLLDGKIIAVGDNNMDVIVQLLYGMDLGKSEVITIYYGADTEAGEPDKISASVAEQYPNLQVELIRGGQSHYSYIISVE
jgi:dihydroxyacetone kinase-like predicted kinase